MQLNIVEAAKFLGISVYALRSLVDSNKIPSLNVGKKKKQYLRFDPKALRAFRTESRQNGKSVPSFVTAGKLQINDGVVPAGYVDGKEASRITGKADSTLYAKFYIDRVRRVKVGKRVYWNAEDLHNLPLSDGGRRLRKAGFVPLLPSSTAAEPTPLLTRLPYLEKRVTELEVKLNQLIKELGGV